MVKIKNCTKLEKKWTKIIVEETEKLVKIDKIDRLNRGNCKIGKKKIKNLTRQKNRKIEKKKKINYQIDF